MNRPIHIIIAGGGTGGHLFPGIAIAQAFITNPALHPDGDQNRILFIGSGKSFEATTLSKAGFAYQAICVEGIKRRGIWNQLKAVCKIPIAVLQSLGIFFRFKPDVVIGVGGYSSGPVAIAAKLWGIPIVLHEQNVLPGMTNRMLSYLADRIYVSFEDTKQRLASEKVLVTGNPVRTSLIEGAESPKPTATQFTVLILGGSQGAHSINTAVMEALEQLPEKNRYHFIHQTGADDEAVVRDAYERSGVSNEVQAFFTDMERRYRRADLLICRAGATTVAEITAIGKAAIFIPFPYAADNHQVLNARALSDSGAAELILQPDLTPERLSQRIQYYASNPQIIDIMAAKAKQFGKPDAANRIAEDCYQLLNNLEPAQ